MVELDVRAIQGCLSPRLTGHLKQLPESVREFDEASRRFFLGWAADLNKGGDCPNPVFGSENSDEH